MKNTDELRKAFNAFIQENQFVKAPSGLYDPVNYILSLGGKRIRPVLLLLSYNLFKDDVEKALPAAFGIELFHNFTLLHDDIMDEADIRRGKLTVHKKFSTNAGILSGDVMLIYVYQYLAQLENKTNLPEILAVFNKMAIEVCEGQQYDMDFEQQQDVAIPDYLRMIELKTAVLLGAALQIGAIIGGAGQLCAENLYKFGRNIGLAFQLQDDMLDTYGDEALFGKKTGGDIVRNKKTFLVLKTLELASPEDKRQLLEFMNDTPVDEAAKISNVIALFDKYNVNEHADALKETYLEQAFAALDEVAKPDTRKTVLRRLAEKLMMRKV